ncbi:MAG TPA: site-2 protease family protein [Acidimicrobiales bacterium]|nr:site-2 protease family protein [Acidimicrobiales bacterium]
MIGRPPSVQTSNRSALYRLLALVAAVVLLTLWLHGFDVLIVVLALVVMVMAHEAGHFVTAKLSGMKVTEYFLGFGPRILSFRRGETEYGVKAIPAGGYVKIVGMTGLEEVDPLDEARSYRQSTFPRRVLVGVAGSTMHFVMAFLLLWGMVAFAGLPSSAAEIGGFTTYTNAVSPAKAAGLHAGDVVVSVDGRAVPTANDFVNYVHAHPDARLDLGVRRAGRLVSVVVVSRDARGLDVAVNGVPTPEIKAKQPVGVIGVALGQSYVTENPLSALGRAGALLGSVTRASFAGLGEIFSPHGLASFARSVASARSQHAAAAAGNTGATGNSGQLVSILGAIQVGAQAAHQNVSELLYILVAVNVFVGIVNLVPMLPLDGGHVAIAVYERLRSRRGRRYHADVAKLMPVAYLFLAFILVLGLGALYANAVNPVHLPGG